MLFTLIPPPALALPENLQSHTLSPPTYSSRKSGPTKHPFAYTRTKRALERLDLKGPSILVADVAIWRTVAVQEITFDLDACEILVVFIDNTSESFPLEFDESPEISQEYVIETDDEESQKERMRKKSVEKSRYGKVTLFARLQELAGELRDAWEDVSILSDENGPLVSTKQDFDTLMKLSANPSKEIPRRWKRQIVSVDANERMEVDTDEQDEGSWELEKLATQNSQLSTRSATSPPPLPDPRKYSGQLVPRRRDNSTSLANAIPSTSSPSSSYESPNALKPTHDVESFLQLLETTRHSLVDLWSNEVLPLLKERSPPNFSLFITTNASKWCKMKAVVERAKLAKMLTELAVDEGNVIDATDSEAEDSSFDESDSELDEDMVDQHHLRKMAKDDRESTRSSKNLLFTMRDDYDLLKWCAEAESSAREMDYDGPDRAPFTINPWPIERSYVDKPPPLARSTRSNSSAIRIISSSASTSSLARKSSARVLTPPTSPLAEATDDDCSTDEDDALHFLETDDFIYPPDPLGYKFLPDRLPHSFSTRADDSDLGPEMKLIKIKVLASMAMINGYQKKNLELEEFIAEQTGNWEMLKAEQREETGRGPSRRRATKQIIPLVQQPLRYAAADKSIAQRLTSALTPLASTSATPAVPLAPTTANGKTPAPLVIKIAPTTPRKNQNGDANLSRRKQISNLTLLSIVGADESSAREVLDRSNASNAAEKTKLSKKRKSVEGGSATKRSKSSSDGKGESSSTVKSIRTGVTGKRKSSKEKNNYPPVPYPSKKGWSSTTTPVMGSFAISASCLPPDSIIASLSTEPLVQEIEDEEMVDEIHGPVIREFDDTGEEILVSSQYDQLEEEEEDELASSDEMEKGFETDDDDDDMERAPTPELEVDLDISDPVEEEEIDELLSDTPNPSSPKSSSYDQLFDGASNEMYQTGVEGYDTPRLGSPALSSNSPTLPFPFSPPFSPAVTTNQRANTVELVAPVATRPFPRIVASVAGEDEMATGDAPFEHVEITRPTTPHPFLHAQSPRVPTALRKHSSLDSIFPQHPSSPPSPRTSPSSAT